ncbi:MAG: LacI family DNA-binding transcriptional regulator [Candidatus Bathyarchaeia archaeon]
MAKRPTIWDVARLAGVSPTTVSRVLNGQDTSHVSEETRARILQVLEKLDYVPIKAARILRRQKSGVVAVLLPDISNPFFALLARGVEYIAFQKGMSVMICDSNLSYEKESRYLDILLTEGVDGVVFVPVDRSDGEKLKRLIRHGICVVVADRKAKGWPVVEADNRGGSYALTKYVIELGYKHIAYIAGPPAVSTSHERLRGFLKAMREKGLNPVAVEYGDFTFEGGHALAKKILREQNVDLIMCGNDLMAMGALHAAAEMHRNVPYELGITGFDHIQFADLVHPPLTTVEVPAFEIGVKAVQLLLSSEKANVCIRTKIIPGGTCVPRG